MSIYVRENVTKLAKLNRGAFNRVNKLSEKPLFYLITHPTLLVHIRVFSIAIPRIDGNGCLVWGNVAPADLGYCGPF